MRKLYCLLAVAAIAFAGCVPDGPDVPDKPERPEEKDPVEYTVRVVATGGGGATLTVDGRDITGGTPVSRATAKAFRSSRIVTTATADEGYEFVKWKITGITRAEPTEPIDIKKPVERTFNPLSFDMPGSDVTVEAEFVALQVPPDPPETPTEKTPRPTSEW